MKTRNRHKRIMVINAAIRANIFYATRVMFSRNIPQSSEDEDTAHAAGQRPSVHIGLVSNR